MPKGIKGFQKGHKTFISKETYKLIGKKTSERQIGRKPSPKVGFQKGHGRFRSDESYKKASKKISVSLKDYFSKYSFKQEKSRSWKGEKAGYFAYHVWLKTYFGKANKCENPDCVYPRKNRAGKITYKPKGFNWALIKGKEHGHFRENYKMLCISCHMIYDNVRGRN